MDVDLTEFLRARLDEDEEAARAATPGPWSALDGGVVSYNDPSDESGNGAWPVTSTETSRDRADRMHIARWDPARVLAEVEAKRAILSRWTSDAQFPDFHGGYEEAMTDAALALARPYVEHPDFDPAWLVPAQA